MSSRPGIRNHIRHFAVWAAIALLLPSLAFGQAQTTGRISGHVVDDAGRPVAGAEVSARNTELQVERTARTGSQGDFLLALLPTGPYIVSVTSPGKQPEVYNLNVGVGQTQPLDVRLLPGEAVSETITVTGTTSALETTAVGQNLDVANEIEQLPVINRSIDTLAQLAPNYSEGPTRGTVAFAGAPSFDTTVLLDGAEISDPYFGSAPIVYLEDSLDELQILTSGVSARYGRFQGGLINAITKSGTNNFDGTLRLELTNQAWNSATPYGETLPNVQSEAYQLTLGGPIVRDRLWFFAGGRTITPSEETKIASYTQTSFVQTREEDRWQLKLRAALTPNHMIEAGRMSYDALVSSYAGLTAGEPTAIGRRGDPRTFTNASYHGVIGARTFLEAQATQKDVSILSGGDPNGGSPFLENATTTMFNNHWWDYSDATVRDNQTGALAATHSLEMARAGQHTIEGGLQYVLSTTGGANRQSPTGLNLVAINTNRDFVTRLNDGALTFNVLSDQALRWAALPLSGRQEVANTALYLQDTIHLNRLRLDVGVRYDKYDGSGPTPDFDLDFAGFAPRLGVTYDVTPSWQIAGSYGRYISRFNDRSANNATGVGAAPRNIGIYIGPDRRGLTHAEVEQLLRDDANWRTIGWSGDTSQPTTFVASDITAPYADDINVSVRHALPRSSGFVTLTYIDRSYHQLLDDFVGQICDRGFEYGETCANTRTIVVPSSTLRPTVDVTVWGNNPEMTRKYRALTAVWDYRPSRRWQLAGNYTYGETKGNYEGEGPNTPSSGSFSGNYPESVHLPAIAPYGYTDDDIRHRINLTSSYDFELQRFGTLSLGSLFRYQSGTPYSLTGAVPLRASDRYASESGNYPYFFGPNGEVDQHARGSRRFNDWWRVDLAARYAVPLFRAISPFVKVSVINVLDNDELIQFQTSGVANRDAAGNVVSWSPAGNCGLDSEPSKNCTGFGKITGNLDYQTPRTFQLTVGLTF